MTDRDSFAAAALTGLLAAPTDKDRSWDYWARLAYEAADAMLARRTKNGTGSGFEVGPDPDSRTWETHPANQPAPPCVETDGFSPGSRTGQINRTPERESPRRECEESSLRDVPQPDNGRAAGGPEHHISKAEIDALQHVVEDGRIVGMSVYGRLRSLLVRLRPEWECEGDSDRPKPINDERLAALEQLSALDQELELEYGLTGNPLIKTRPCKAAKTDTTQPRNGTPAEGSVQGVGSVPDSRNANEPVAWLVKGVEYDTGCEYEYVTLMKEKAEIAAENGGNVIPLFDGPRTWQEEVAAVEDAFDRSGVKPNWPDDEPGNIGPMAAAMEAEIARLRLTDAERGAIESAIWDYQQNEACVECADTITTLRGLLERLA